MGKARHIIGSPFVRMDMKKMDGGGNVMGRHLFHRADFLGPSFVALATMLAFSTVKAEYDERDVRAGEQLAIKACSPCHAIPSESAQEGPHRSGPPFSEIAKGSKARHEPLRTFLLSTHSNVGHPGAMPSPELTEQQIWQIAAYLSSLRDVER
jgi:mono/diheme cytochrome c family protein